MDNQEIIREFIQTEILINNDDVVLSNSVSLTETGIIDSLSIQVLISYLEEKFSIRIDYDEIIPKNFETIVAIANLIQSKLNSSAKHLLFNSKRSCT